LNLATEDTEKNGLGLRHRDSIITIDAGVTETPNQILIFSVSSVLSVAKLSIS